MNIFYLTAPLHLVHVVRRSFDLMLRIVDVDSYTEGTYRGQWTRVDPFCFCPALCFHSICVRHVLSFCMHVSRWILVGNLRTRHSDGSMTVYGWHSSTFKRAKAIHDGFQRIVHILSNSAVKASHRRSNRYQVLYSHYTPAVACSTETGRSICICDCLTCECTM